jgi:hypothetical protein
LDSQSCEEFSGCCPCHWSSARHPTRSTCHRPPLVACVHADRRVAEVETTGLGQTSYSVPSRALVMDAIGREAPQLPSGGRKQEQRWSLKVPQLDASSAVGTAAAPETLNGVSMQRISSRAGAVTYERHCRG